MYAMTSNNIEAEVYSLIKDHNGELGLFDIYAAFPKEKMLEETILKLRRGGSIRLAPNPLIPKGYTYKYFLR